MSRSLIGVAVQQVSEIRFYQQTDEHNSNNPRVLLRRKPVIVVLSMRKLSVNNHLGTNLASHAVLRKEFTVCAESES